MQNNAPITVLLPVFNAEKYLKEAIDSILNQTFSDFEFLIIDDGSTDNSKGIILSYKDTRIRFLANSNNMGLIYTLNRGLDEARGRYIARMDADDISLPERLMKQHSFLFKNPDYSLVGCSAYLIDEHSKGIGQMFRPYNFETIVGNIFFFNPIIHPSTLFDKEFIQTIGGYNINAIHAEDYDLWFRILKAGGKMYCLDDMLLNHREHKNSIENKFFDLQQETVITLLKKYIKEILDTTASKTNIDRYLKLSKRKLKLSRLDKLDLIFFLRRMVNKFSKRYNKASTMEFCSTITIIIDNLNVNDRLRGYLKKIIL